VTVLALQKYTIKLAFEAWISATVIFGLRKHNVIQAIEANFLVTLADLTCTS